MLVTLTKELPERCRRARLLIDSLYDYLPDPPTATAVIRRDEVSGPAAGKRVPCTLCRRSGRVLAGGNGRKRYCPICDGVGWRRRRGPLNKPEHPLYEEPWDEYLGQPVKPQDAQRVHASDIFRLTREIERLDRDRAIREGDIDGERYAWETRRQIYERMGSYRELRRVLGLLRGSWAEGHAVLHAGHWRGVPIRFSRRERIIEELAVAWVANTMRGEIRVPPWLMEEAVKERTQTVESMKAAGFSSRKIAKALGITQEKAKRLLKAA